jgi:glucose/arabinose dehydrogenase
MNRSFVVMVASALLAVGVGAQQRNSPAMPALPQVFDTAVQKIRVSAVAAGLVNPWSLAFLPNGDILVTERAGRLRIIRNGVLDPAPIAGTPTPHVAALSGLLEIALHPRFAENRVVNLT